MARFYRVGPARRRLAHTLLAVNADEAAAHLAGAVRIQTQSHLEAHLIHHPAFVDLHRYLEETFPLVHQHLRREVVSEYSPLYTWEGKDDRVFVVLRPEDNNLYHFSMDSTI